MESERFYQGIVLGQIAELYGRYTAASNGESGFGKYDVMIEPKKIRKYGFAFEGKKVLIG